MRVLVTCLYFIIGFINFIPIVGVFGQDVLSELYGVSVTDPSLVVLMQHRALMFGIVGGVVILACFMESIRVLASAMAGASMAGYMVLVWRAGDVTEELQKVFNIDLVAIFLLGVATVLQLRISKTDTQSLKIGLLDRV